MSGLFISASGVLNALQRQRVTANNVANFNTGGFQASRVSSTPAPGGGVRLDTITRDTSQGPLINSSDQLDIAPSQGYFRVERSDGSTAYTRDGRFGLNADGEVVTADGSRLVPPIQVPADSTGINVTRDGRVYASVPGQGQPVEAGRFEVVTFANPQGLEALGNGEFTATAASGAAAPVGQPEIYSGVYQGSNVNLATEQTNQILDLRTAQANVNAFRAQDEVLGELLDLEG